MEIDRPAQAGWGVQRISYAQNMEDVLLDRLFGGAAGTFMDVGANHPFVDSNTYFFYLRGWRGFNLEPSPRGLALFREFRPEDTNLPVAASDADGELTFYEISGPDGPTGLSTLDGTIAGRHRDAGFAVHELPVSVRSVASLVDEYRIDEPDFLSIDVEGHEGHVIQGLPLATWRPKVLVVESTLPGTATVSHGPWEPTLVENGYLFAAFNGVNRFYLRDDLRDRIGLLQTPVNVFDRCTRHETVLLRQDADRLRAEVACARAEFDKGRRSWEWAVAQAEQAQVIRERERASFEEQRASWHAAHEFFEKSLASWEWERKRYEYDRGAWDQARGMYERERAEWVADRGAMAYERSSMEAERTRMALEREAWERERADGDRLLHEARSQLRPYQLIDRLGVVSRGVGLARRVRSRPAS